jgi:hypothetical protein
MKMQTIVSELAFTFVDDAIALARGAASVARDLAAETLKSIRARLFAPVDRLALACDVGNVLSDRQAAMTRPRTLRVIRSAPTPRRLRDRFNIFRGLRDLT